MQKSSHVKVSAKKGGSKKKMPISHMVIEPANGGFTSKVHHKRPPSTKDMPYPDAEEEQPTVHPNVQSLADHVTNMGNQMMAENGGDGDNDADDQPEGEKAE